MIGLQMSNQRPGKIEKKLDRNGDMQVFKFFKTAQKVLEDSDSHPYAPFYMEQMVDWLRSGKTLKGYIKKNKIIKVFR